MMSRESSNVGVNGGQSEPGPDGRDLDTLEEEYVKVQHSELEEAALDGAHQATNLSDPNRGTTASPSCQSAFN